MWNWKILTVLAASAVAIPGATRTASANPYGYSAYYGGVSWYGGATGCPPVNCLPSPCLTRCPQPACPGNACGVSPVSPACDPCGLLGNRFNSGGMYGMPGLGNPGMVGPGYLPRGGGGFVDPRDNIANPGVDPYGPVLDPLSREDWDDLNPAPGGDPYGDYGQEEVDPRDAPYYGASRAGGRGASSRTTLKPVLRSVRPVSRSVRPGARSVQPVSRSVRSPFFE